MAKSDCEDIIKQNLLVTLADNSFIEQAKQLFSSTYWNAGWQGDYMLLSHQIPENELKWFRDKGVLAKKCEPLIDLFTGEYNYPPVVYDKLYLFTPEFKKWKSIVYLDSDIIVKDNIDRLIDIKTFGAIRDCENKKLKEQFFQSTRVFKDMQIDFKKPSFNSGVMAINTDIITNSLFSELQFLVKNFYKEFRFADQAVLNLYFYRKWEKLPPIYNLYINEYNYKLPNSNKCVAIHFFTNAGYPKLWDVENPYFSVWKSNLEKSEFIDLKRIIYTKKWGCFKIIYYSLLLRMVIPLQHLSNSIDACLGCCGLILKKCNVNLYNRLRRNKHDE